MQASQLSQTPCRSTIVLFNLVVHLIVVFSRLLTMWMLINLAGVSIATP
jgi:hypothetical protein